MPSITELINSARVYLGNPAADKPTDEAILNALFGRITHYQNWLKLSNQNWLVKETQLDVDALNYEYTLSAIDFGRPLKVEYLNPHYPYTNGQEIEMVLLQDANLVEGNSQWYSSIRNTIDESDGAYIARAIAFYNLGATPQVRIIPRPLQQATYRIMYEPSSGELPTLLQDPELCRNYHDMLAMAAAKLCLPHCKYDANTYNQFKESIWSGLADHERTFDQFRRQAKHPDTRLRRPFIPGRN